MSVRHLEDPNGVMPSDCSATSNDIPGTRLQYQPTRLGSRDGGKAWDDNWLMEWTRV